MWYKNIAGRFFGLVTKHACDGRTDRQNYDSQDRASIASRGKNRSKLECGPMPNLMAALPNIGGALCWTPQSFADAHY